MAAKPRLWRELEGLPAETLEEVEEFITSLKKRKGKRETFEYSTPNYTAPQISSSFALIFASKISISFRFDSTIARSIKDSRPFFPPGNPSIL